MTCQCDICREKRQDPEYQNNDTTGNRWLDWLGDRLLDLLAWVLPERPPTMETFIRERNRKGGGK